MLLYCGSIAGQKMCDDGKDWHHRRPFVYVKRAGTVQLHLFPSDKHHRLFGEGGSSFLIGVG